MEGDGFIQHNIYCWVVKNVYLCKELLTSRIEGLPFKTSKCKWTLQLGQCEESKGDGICLLIVPTGTFKKAWVDLHVSVREQTSAKPFLHRKFQNKFHKGLAWSSPVIITNETFLQKFVTSRKLSRFWEIRVELMYNEETGLKLAENVPPMITNLSCERKGGADLKFLDGQFNDIFIKIAAEEINAHKTIIHTRCVYFSDKLCSYEESLAKEDDLNPMEDPEVMKSVMVYLYEGDTYALADPFPLGIHKCTKRMKFYDLEWFTQPTEAGDTTCVDSKTVYLEFDFLEFEKNVNKKSPININSSVFGDYSNNMFSLLIKGTLDKSSPHLSVSIKMVSGDPIFAHLELSVLSKSKKVIFTKKMVGHLEKDGYLGFENFTSVGDLLNNKECIDEGTLHLICKIIYSNGRIVTCKDGTSGKFIFDICDGENLSPGDIDCATHNGHPIMFEYLKRLLKTSAFSDCTVVVGGKTFHAHKVILAARSSYFSEKLGGSRIRTLKSVDTSVSEIVVDRNIPSEQMNIILEEIYTGSAEILDESTAIALYPLSKFFGLSKLETKCLLHMKAIPADPYVLDKIPVNDKICIHPMQSG